VWRCWDWNEAALRRIISLDVASGVRRNLTILRERTKSGLDAARKQGRIGGRRHKLRPNQQDEIVTMVSAGNKAVQRSSSDSVATFG
jgi:DNA invertase Pin-like site-specific DNA recombinase